MELCSMFHGRLGGRSVWGRMVTYICMAESFGCSPETITTLFMGYTPIQNRNFKKQTKMITFLFCVFLCIICVKSIINLLQYIAYSQLCQLGTLANFFELMNKLDL